MKYIVYLTTNLKSKHNGKNKIYVGVHLTENPDIFDGYIGCGTWKLKPSTYMYPKTPFQYAVKKYGVDAFVRTTLYTYDTIKEAFEQEAKIVNKVFVKSSYTYNVAIGGKGGSLYLHNPQWQSKPIYQFDRDGKLIKKWEYTLTASEFYGEPYSRFDNAISHGYIFLDSYWSRESEINLENYSKSRSQYTYVYNKDGKLIAEYSSRKDCAEALHCCPQSVSKAVKTQSIIKGVYVSDNLVDEFVVKPRIPIKNSMIYVYDVNNNFIGKGVGKEIMKIINLHSYNSIWSAFYSNNGWYKDFYLSFNPVEKVPEKLHSKRRKIDIYDKFGNLIETLESLKIVKEKYNLNSSELDRILKGIKLHNQYIFKYNSK